MQTLARDYVILKVKDTSEILSEKLANRNKNNDSLIGFLIKQTIIQIS